MRLMKTKLAQYSHSVQYFPAAAALMLEPIVNVNANAGMGQVAPGNHTPNYQSATHFYSEDGGATWAWTGNASGATPWGCAPLRAKNTIAGRIVYV